MNRSKSGSRSYPVSYLPTQATEAPLFFNFDIEEIIKMFISNFYVNRIICYNDIATAMENKMEEKINMPIDWSQFIPTMIATFVAFMLTLLGTYLYDMYKDNEQKKAFLINLRKELEDIQRELGNINRLLEDGTCSSIWVVPLKTYIWDSIIENNKASLISDEYWYKDLLAIYHMAREYNSWHLLRTEIILQGLCKGNRDDDITDGIIKLKEELESKINTVINEMSIG